MSNSILPTNEEIREELTNGEYVPNNYPCECNSTVARTTFSIDEEGLYDVEKKKVAKYLPTADTTCYICNSATKGDESLIQCEGFMNGTLTDEYGPPCKNRFHLSCIRAYNASSFDFQYAARPECQDKLLCSLHSCSWCSINLQKQGAYCEHIIECVLCAKSFHYNTCFPSGAIEFDVVLETEDGKKITLKMMICPNHVIEPTAKKAIKLHLDLCYYCGYKPEDEKLVKCKTCVRSFHQACIITKTKDGKPLDKNLCDYCQCEDFLRADVPVLAIWNGKFVLGTTKWWEFYPIQNSKAKKPKNYQTVGFTVIDWSSDSNPSKQYSIVPISNLAPLEEYLLPLATTLKDRNDWEKALNNFDELGRFPNFLKDTYTPIKTIRKFKNTKEKFATETYKGLCDCVGENRCSENSGCIYRTDQTECPPGCSEKGTCNNRNISSKSQKGLQKIVKKPVGKMGFGIFATKAFEKDEYVGEYVGELIDKNEEEKRTNTRIQSKDHQAGYYMLSLSKGRTIDAARFGNILRFVNHSCNPNCKAFITRIYKGKRGDKAWFVDRVGLMTIRKIAEGEELTFTYRMNNTLNMKCKCGAENCTGWLYGSAADDTVAAGKKKKKVAQASGKKGSSRSAPGPAPRRRQNTPAHAKSTKTLLKPLPKPVNASKTEALEKNEKSKVKKPAPVRKSRKRVLTADPVNTDLPAKKPTTRYPVDDDGAGPAPPPGVEIDDEYDDSDQFDEEMSPEKENRE